MIWHEDYQEQINLKIQVIHLVHLRRTADLRRYISADIVADANMLMTRDFYRMEEPAAERVDKTGLEDIMIMFGKNCKIN